MSNKIKLMVTLLCIAFSSVLTAQAIHFNNAKLLPVNVFMSLEMLHGQKTVKVVKDPSVKEFDEPTFVKIGGTDFQNGTIEIRVLSRLLKDAPDYSRGFIGLAFRINADHSKFECIYLRPTNGRAEQQLRRNRSTQYFSYPDFKFERLRKEYPGEYESYADMGLDEWIKIRIEVKGKQARLFLNDNKQPTLIVNDLKHGIESTGAIGLWVDIGTEGYFSNLKIVKD